MKHEIAQRIRCRTILIALGCSEIVSPGQHQTDSKARLDLILIAGNCPAQFILTKWEQGAEPDHNGDGYVCQNVVDLVDGTLVTSIDNNIPSTVLGGCPPNFLRQPYIISEEGFDPIDRNENGCTLTRPNGEQVVIDDNIRGG